MVDSIALNEVVNNVSIADVLPPEVVASLGTLVTILKAIGVAFLIYLIYMIVSGVLSWRKNRKISKMYEIVNEINNKLDKVLEKEHKHKESHKEEKRLRKKEKIKF